jgi:hypothetical protein
MKVSKRNDNNSGKASSLLNANNRVIKHTEIIRTAILLTTCFLLFSSCWIFSPSANEKDPAIENKDCLFGLKQFNDELSHRVISNIAAVLRSGNQSKIAELKDLYPEFRDTWNKMTLDISRNYTSSYRVSDFPVLTTDQLINPRSASIPAASKFHLLLFVFKNGPYPSGSNDTDKLLAYKEHADLATFINTRLRARIQEKCTGISDKQVRAAIRPAELPQTIEECL